MNEWLVLPRDALWIGVGLAGQALFSFRFLVQWLRSEREGRSIIPVAFWYFSLAGGVVLLTYALHRADPVFIIGQTAGLFIYARNLFFITRERRRHSHGRERPSGMTVPRP